MLPYHLDRSLNDWFDQLPMKVQLSEELSAALELERGLTAPGDHQSRKKPRYRCFGQAVAIVRRSPLALPHFEDEAIVIIRDLSRNGMGLITHQQYYPEQDMVVLYEDRILEGRVARARKIETHCYEVGMILYAQR